MIRTRRPLGACAAAVALAVGLTGCSLFEGSDAGKSQEKTVTVPGQLPVTFSSDARWAVDLVDGTAPVELSEGLAVLQPGPGEGTYRVALISAYDGSQKWISKTVTNPSPDVPPKVSTTSVGGKSWVLVEGQKSKNQVTLDAYAAQGTGDRREPRSTGVFTGLDATTLPEVNVGAEGVVVHYSSNPDFAAWEKEVKERDAAYEKAKKKAKKGKAPKKPRELAKPKNAGSLQFDPESGKSSVYEGPGTIRSVWSEGTLVTNPVDDAGFGFVVDKKTAWASNEVKPPGAHAKSNGVLVATGPGVLVGRWSDEDGAAMLSVHEIRSGKVIASLKGLSSKVVAASEGRSVTVSSDGQWASWGPFVFGLRGGKSALVPLHSGEVATIYRDVLYVKHAKAPLTASSALKTPAAEESSAASDSDPKWEGMVDVSTGDPLTNTAPEEVPLFVSSASQGVFVIASDRKTRLYSTPLN